MTIPFSASAERNKGAILAVLLGELDSGDRVLEIGSGSGQHLRYFARSLPGIHWQPSETADALSQLKAGLGYSDAQAAPVAGLSNLASPVELDVCRHPWPGISPTCCYSANTLHIMDMQSVAHFFTGAADCLVPGGRVLVYGPFRFAGKHISEGNRHFDSLLRQSGSGSGIRDVETLDELAQTNGFQAARRIPMPSNNHLLIWSRAPAADGC